MHKKGGTICDIGSIPRMELIGGTFPELPADARRLQGPSTRKLERAFYPFAAIDWLDLAEARKQSLATGKPLHVVLMFGSLPDESC
jgi:hypothetical protein